MYLVAYSFGFSSVPGTGLSEIFPETMKSIGACMSMVDSVGEVYVFWMHAGFSLLAIPCALFLLPETKEKTFQEIQHILANT